jgi:hypothetical protein
MLSTLMLLSLFVGACGDGHGDAGSIDTTNSASALPNPKGQEADDDSDTHKAGYYYDFDDLDFRAYGVAAGAVEGREVSMLVKHYYEAAAAADGATACGLLDSHFATLVPAEYGQASVLHGKTCAIVASKVFKQLHYQLSVDNATLDVGAVRVGGGRGYALLGFEGALPVRYVVIVQERGVWKMASLIDIAFP